MLRDMRRRSLPLLALTLIAGRAVAAESTPRCTPAREGEAACLDGKLCLCRHDPGGSLTGRRAGTRWDCGALRPPCGTTAAPPPDAAGQPQQPLPFLPVPVQPEAGGQPQQPPPFLPVPPSPGWR